MDSVELLKTALPIVATGLAGLAGWAFKTLSSRLEEVMKQAEARAKRAEDEVENIRSQVAAWQLESLKGFATKQELEKLERRIDEGFARLEAKLDRVLAAGHDRRS
jgi:hypothetical protein